MFFCGGTYYNSDYICANCGILLKCPICAEKTTIEYDRSLSIWK